MNCKLTIILLIVGFLCSSCKKDPKPLFSNGMITGTVRTNEGTSAESTTIIAHGPYGNSATLTDSDGKYKLPGLGNGTYEIEFSKEGYGKKFKQGVQVFGKDTNTINISLLKKVNYKMPKLSLVLYYTSFQQMDEYSVAIKTDIPADNNEDMQIRVFIDDTKEVSDKHYMFSDMAYADKLGATQLLVTCANPQIVNSNGEHLFKKGQTIYLIAYVCNIHEEIGEFSEYYGLPIFSTADEEQHSQVIEIKAP